MVYLEIAGVHHQAQGRLDNQAHGIGDAVANAEPLHNELTELDLLSRLYYLQPGAADGPILLQLHLYETRGQPGRIDGYVQVPQHVGQGAGMVLVAVGDQDCPDFVPVLLEIGYIWYDQVYPQHVLLREEHSGIDNDNIVIALQGHHVLPNLTETAQGDDFQRLFHCKPQNMLNCSPFVSVSTSTAGVSCLTEESSSRRAGSFIISSSMTLRRLCW